MLNKAITSSPLPGVRAGGRLQACIPSMISLICALGFAGCAHDPGAAQQPSSGFTLRGPDIISPSGEHFIVKGVSFFYGNFIYLDHSGDFQVERAGMYPSVSHEHAERDLDRLKALGVNTVRIFVRPVAGVERTHLKDVVLSARKRGFVVLLSNSYSTLDESLPWLKELARSYRNDPYVWINPMNEPNCNSIGGLKTSACDDWEVWHRDTLQYVQALRSEGFKNPIVIDTVHWSWDLSEIENFSLKDPRIIYGVHRYANKAQTFDAEEKKDCDESWGNLSSTFPVILEEIGHFNGKGTVSSLEWQKGFANYLSDWIRNRKGGGMIGFNWLWSDGNSMARTDGSLTPWGEIFFGEFIKEQY